MRISLLFSVIGFFYVKNRGKGGLVGRFVPRRKRADRDFLRIAAEKAAMKWHKVRSGDTVSGIAAKYGKSQRQIVSLNPGLNVNRIRIGQKIRVN